MNICPKCSTINKNPKANFCYNCGTRLLNTNSLKEEYLNHKKSFKTVEKVESLAPSKNTNKILNKSLFQDTISKKWVNFVLGLNILAASFLLVSIGIYFRSVQDKSVNKISPLAQINSVEIDTEELKQENTTNVILNSKFYSIVPQHPLFYIESNNIYEFLTNLLNKDQIIYLEKTYEIPLKDLLAFTNNQFAYVKAEKDNWAVITSPSSVDFFERAFSNYQKNKEEDKNIITARIGKYWVFSNNKEYLDNIRSASDDTLLSIEKDSRFTSKISKAPKNAFFLSFSFSETYAEDNYEEELKKLGMESVYEEVKKVGFKPFAIIPRNNKFELIFL